MTYYNVYFNGGFKVQAESIEEAWEKYEEILKKFNLITDLTIDDSEIY